MFDIQAESLTFRIILYKVVYGLKHVIWVILGANIGIYTVFEVIRYPDWSRNYRQTGNTCFYERKPVTFKKRGLQKCIGSMIIRIQIILPSNKSHTRIYA